MDEQVKPFLLRLPSDLIKRLSNAAGVYKYRTGNQVAANVLEHCLDIWERGERAKLSVFEQYRGADLDNLRPLQPSSSSSEVADSSSTALVPLVVGEKQPLERGKSVSGATKARGPGETSKTTSATGKRRRQ